MSSELRGSFSIVVAVVPEKRRVDLTLSGDVDITAIPGLADAVDRVAAIAPNVIVVDLAAITFAGSVLLDFLTRVHLALPARSALVVCRPTPAIRRILEIAAIDRLATIRDEPVPGCASQAAMTTAGPQAPLRVTRCRAGAEITASQLTTLNGLPDPVEFPPPWLVCELADGHEDAHVAFALASHGGNQWWWLRWGRRHEVIEIDPCEVTESEELDADFCILPDDHPGPHSFEL